MNNTPPTPSYEPPRDHYLISAGGHIRSWLLTTDHKRIALLYLISVTVFFFIGGVFATMIRIHLLTPDGVLVTPETYNKLFTMHGVAMIFFFLIPSIPAVLGNFLIPMMIGAKDLAFPSWLLRSCLPASNACFTWAFSIRPWAAIPFCSSICSGSIPTPRCTSWFSRPWEWSAKSFPPSRANLFSATPSSPLQASPSPSLASWFGRTTCLSPVSPPMRH